jgi:polysaccharide pyruvyl transferase WcaK-like protein
MALYSAARFVVGCRLHSAIFAIVSGTPAVAISLAEAKAEAVLAEVGLERFVIADDFQPNELLQLLREIAADGGAPVRAEVRAAAKEARRRTRMLPEVLKATADATGNPR